MAQDQNQDFSDIALAKFLQTSPELGNLILTFKDVSDDLQEDTGIKVGIFILKSGMDIFYVPVVSKDGNVYPIDSIFVAGNSKFLPLTKKTTMMVLNSSQMNPGKPVKTPNSVNRNPDLSHLVNPPRTGKFNYASSSRLGDFLSAMPQYLKDFTFEKVAEEKSMYEELHKLFAIKDIFKALRADPQSLARETNAAPISIVTGPSASSLNEVQVKSMLDNGYYIQGKHPSNRVAISAFSFEEKQFAEVRNLDGNSDYNLMFNSGSSREAFIPKILDVGVNSKTPSVALFTNGDYAISSEFVSRGGKLARTNVLPTLFNYNPPVLPRDVEKGDTFAILDTSGKLLGIFNARSVVLNHMGIEIRAYAEAGAVSGVVTICAYRSYGSYPTLVDGNLYIPYSSLVMELGTNVSGELERNINSASRKSEMTQASLLGDQLNLGFDGVEFSVNGCALGKEAKVMERLVIEEGIDPDLALTFVKQAKEKRLTKIYLTKRAATSFPGGEMPEFGQKLAPAETAGLSGSFIPNVQRSLQVGDPQSTEATIISELLQTPDMIALIPEYLPDIEECLDKLGRILLLSRVHINQLSENNDSDGVFSFLATLKSVYRSLGDSYMKLQEMMSLNLNSK